MLKLNNLVLVYTAKLYNSGIFYLKESQFLFWEIFKKQLQFKDIDFEIENSNMNNRLCQSKKQSYGEIILYIGYTYCLCSLHSVRME